jgi:hypothetical protein
MIIVVGGTTTFLVKVRPEIRQFTTIDLFCINMADLHELPSRLISLHIAYFGQIFLPINKFILPTNPYLPKLILIVLIVGKNVLVSDIQRSENSNSLAFLKCSPCKVNVY